MIRAPEITQEMIDEGRKRGRELQSAAFHELAMHIGNGVRKLLAKRPRHDPARRPETAPAMHSARFTLLGVTRAGWL